MQKKDRNNIDVAVFYFKIKIGFLGATSKTTILHRAAWAFVFCCFDISACLCLINLSMWYHRLNIVAALFLYGKLYCLSSRLRT